MTKMLAISNTREYIDGDVEADAEYYRAHFSRALRQSDHLATVVRRLRSHFTPEDIVKARALEDRLYAQTCLSREHDPLVRLEGCKEHDKARSGYCVSDRAP